MINTFIQPKNIYISMGHKLQTQSQSQGNCIKVVQLVNPNVIKNAHLPTQLNNGSCLNWQRNKISHKMNILIMIYKMGQKKRYVTSRSTKKHLIMIKMHNHIYHLQKQLLPSMKVKQGRQEKKRGFPRSIKFNCFFDSFDFF